MRHYLIFCFFLSLPHYAFAQEAENDSTQQVLLSAAKVVALRKYSPLHLAPVQQIGGADLRRMSALSLADALRHLAGVQLKDYGGVGGLKTIDVRAMGTQHTAVSLDGIAIGTAQNGIVDLGRFSTDQLQELSLSHGSPSQEGLSATTRAAAQLLQLNSRKPNWLPHERRHLEVRARWGSFSSYNTALRWEEKLSPSHSLSAQLEGFTTTGRYPFTYRILTAQGLLAHDTTALRDNSDVQWLRAQLEVQNSKLRTQAYLYVSQRGLPGAVVRGKFVHADRQWDRQFFLQSNGQEQWGKQGLYLRGKLSHDYLRYRSDPSRDAGTMYVDHRYKQSQAYLSATYAYTHQDWKAEVASDYALAHVWGNAAQFPQPTRHSLHNALSLQWQPSGWQLQGSLVQIIHHEHTTDRSTSPTAIHWAPTIGLAHQRGTWTWRAYWKGSLRLPTLSDLYYTIVGNALLKPERAQQLNLGTTWKAKGWSLEADVYHNWVSDKIVAVPTSNQFRWTMQNLGQVGITGLDLKASATFPLPLQCVLHSRSTYSYQQALDLTSPLTPYYRHQIAYAPRHAASALLRLTRRETWLAYSFIYTGERYDQQMNIPANYAPPWYTSDLAAGQSFRWRGVQALWQAEVSNLFDQRYEVVKGYPMPGISFRLTLTLRW